MNVHASFAVLLLAMLSTSTVSAAECKYKQNETDMFTKQRVITTEWDSLKSGTSKVFGKVLGDWSDFEVGGMREGEQLFLRFKVELSDTAWHEPLDSQLKNAVLIPDGTSLTVVMADKSEVLLYAEKAVWGRTTAEPDNGVYVVRSTLVASYPLNEETAQALAAQEASHVSMTVHRTHFEFGMDGRFVELDIHDKSKGGIRDAIDCLK